MFKIYIILNVNILCCYAIYYSEQKAVRDDYVTLAAHFAADQLQKALRSNVNELLAVPVFQSIIDGLSFTRTSINISVVFDVAAKIDDAFAHYTSLLRETQTFIIANRVKRINSIFPKQIIECSRFNPLLLSYKEQFGTQVNLSSVCGFINQESAQFNPQAIDNLTKLLRRNIHDSGVRWQYLVDLNGTHIEYPAHLIPKHKYLRWVPFLNVALNFKRRIIIVADLGTIHTDAQLSTTKHIAKMLLSSILPGDRYLFVPAPDSAIDKSRRLNNFWDIASESLTTFYTYIDSLVLAPSTNFSHSSVIARAYSLIAEDEVALKGTGEKLYNILFYISRGIMSEMSETASVLQEIASIKIRTNVVVKINTIALVADKTSMTWSVDFLRSIADQNYARYYHAFPHDLRNSLIKSKLTSHRGKMFIFTEGNTSFFSLAQIYDMLSKEGKYSARNTSTSEIHWSYPIIESNRAIISMSIIAGANQNMLSAAGIDINIDIVADVVKYTELVVMSNFKHRFRLFVCDLKGRVIIDSRMRQSHAWPLHISDVEGWLARDRMRIENFSSKSFDRGSFDLVKPEGDEMVHLRYSWIRLKHAPLVVISTLKQTNLSKHISFLQKRFRQMYALDDLVYHRLDIQHNPSLHYCNYFGETATFEFGGVYLSPSCFTSPSFMMTKSPQWITNYWVYLGDPFGLIRNTGIRSGVREHVGALSLILSYWKKTEYHDYVIRRFIATSRGVMITYPATVVRDNYQPNTEAWFTRATKSPGKIAVTGPFLDDQLGQIVTLSTAVFEGRSSTLHNSNIDQIFAIIGMDVPADYMAKLLRDHLPTCREFRRCMLFDDLGYIITHDMKSKLNDGSSMEFNVALLDAVEKFHMSHLESQLTRHLISSVRLVEKKRCINWLDRSVERFFKFNVTFSDAVRVFCDDGNRSAGSKLESLRAEVISVPQSNIFLALFNQSCVSAHPIQEFCPCSVTDRRCLLCFRFDASDCECPCQCPLDCDHHQSCSYSTSDESLSDSHVSECDMYNHIVPFSVRSLNKLPFPNCVEIRCDTKITVNDCLGVVGCQWCTMYSDGATSLERPYCTDVDSCFRGIEGKRIRSLFDISSQITNQWPVSGLLGPVAAGIMSVFLMIVVATYCYRNQANRLREASFLADSFGTPLCAGLAEDNEFQFDHDSSFGEGKVVSVLQLASFERNIILPTAIQQFNRVSSRSESSDHGYSTMIDRMAGEDSECTSSSHNISRQTEKTLLPVEVIRKKKSKLFHVVTAELHEPPLLEISNS